MTHLQNDSIPSFNVIRTRVGGSYVVRSPEVVSPKFCISIPTYKRADLLKEAIISALGQEDIGEFVVLVVDNCGDETTKKLIQSIADSRLGYYINCENVGMTQNWNQCVELSPAPMVTVLHDDDTLSPRFLKRAKESLERFQSDVYCCASVSGDNPDVDFFDNGKVSIYNPRSLVFGNLTSFPGVLFPKRLFTEVGGFKNSAYPCADYAFWFQLSGVGKIIVDSSVLAFYRVGANQASNNEYLRIVRSSHRLKYRMAIGFGASRFVAVRLARISTARLRCSYLEKYSKETADVFCVWFSSKLLYPIFRRLWLFWAKTDTSGGKGFSS